MFWRHTKTRLPHDDTGHDTNKRRRRIHKESKVCAILTLAACKHALGHFPLRRIPVRAVTGRVLLVGNGMYR